MRTLVWACIAATLILTPAQAHETDASSLEGYSAHEPAGAAESVPLTITRSGETWRAEVSGGPKPAPKAQPMHRG